MPIAKLGRKHILRGETREGEMTESLWKKRRKASVSDLGQGKRQMTQGQRSRHSLVS